jgi:regulator of nucleoside diphosphate kinase
VIQSRSVLVSARDHARLSTLVAKSAADSVALLYDELDSATIVADDELPTDVVAMGSEVTFEDLASGARSQVVLVYPHQANASHGHVSVLAPVGAALIGLREGETIEWPVPKGAVRRLRVVAVAQSAGDVDQPTDGA